MEVASKTDKGKIRVKNEDSLYIDVKDKRLLIIADGMGGHNAGEVASKIAVDTVEQYLNTILHSDYELKVERIKDILMDAISAANGEIYRQSLKEASLRGMGTTIIIVLIIDNKMHIGHVGDSRGYLIRDGHIEQITEDHTLVTELVKNGTITELEAMNHPKRNVITRALGTDISSKIDYIGKDLQKDDIIILCTDGLSDMIKNYEIKDIITDSPDLQSGCDELVDLANLKGGFDNITLIAARISEGS